MSSSAGVQIEVADVDQSQLIALGRNLAHAHTVRLFQCDKANLHRTIFGNNFVGQALRSLQLLRRDGICREVDGAALISHVKRNRREVMQLLKRRG